MSIPKQAQTQLPLWQALRIPLSSARLEKYLLATDVGAEWCARYLWNLALCRSLYPLLNFLEVGLRNRINTTVAKQYPINKKGDYLDIATWLDATKPILHAYEQRRVAEAKRKLRSENRFRSANDRVLSPGRLVAALSFGFWVSLFDGRYDQTGDAPVPFWPALAPEVFPHMPRPVRTRTDVSRALNEIRSLRNRVFHHEPIWRDEIYRGPQVQSDGSTAIVTRTITLYERYESALRFLSWVDPYLYDMAVALNDFPMVHRAGPEAFDGVVRNLDRRAARSSVADLTGAGVAVIN